MRLVSIAMATLLTEVVAGQACLRPTPPPGGFPTDVELAVPVTYSDGYATFGSMQLPDVPPPSCGWPLVVYVHQLGANRFDDLAFQTMLVTQGYAVWSYDVRGQGQALAANPNHPNGGTTLWGPVERHDLAEQIGFVAGAQTWAGVVDATRVAVVGKSQGAAHAWQAAAFSGQPLTTPGRAPTTFPPVRCVIAHDLVADAIEDWARDGTMFSSWWVEAIAGSYQGVPFDAAFLQSCRNAFLAQDPAGLAATFVAEGRDIGAMLASSTVPVLYGHAYFDIVSGPMSGIERLESMSSSGRALLSTVGHGVPPNLLEMEQRELVAQRWLNRFLWDVANEVELERPHLLAVVPLDALERDDPTHAWSHAHVDALTTPSTVERLHLRDDFSLSSAAQAQPAVATVSQSIDPTAVTFTPQDYLDDPLVRDLSNVLAACPVSEQVWSTVLIGDWELSRSASLHLRVVPQHQDWMLAAMLTVEPVGGDEVAFASAAIASRSSTPGVAETHELRLPPVAVRIPDGATVRLRLRNLWLREAPMAQSLEVAPLFTDFAVDVGMGPGPSDSWLDLPVQPAPPRLVVDRLAIDLAAPQPVVATIRGGAARGGYPYFAALGISGQFPSTPYLNDVVPVDGDWLVLASAASTTTPYYLGFLGWLDTEGRANCTVDFSSVGPLPQVLNGLQLTLVAFIWDGPWAPTGAAANPCDLFMR